MSTDCESCDCPKKINHFAIILMSFSLICVLALLRDDQIGIKAGGTIRLPFIGADVDFGSFLFVGPSILIFITLYLHIYVQQWYNCRNHQQKNICILKVDSELAGFLCNFLYFVLSPAILLLFYFISRGKPDYSYFTGFWFAVIAGLMPFLFFAYRKMWRAWIGSVIFFFLFLGSISYLFLQNFDLADSIPLRLQGADMKNHNLTKFNLKGMQAESADFKNCVFYKQNLSSSNGSRATFDNSNLYGANLNNAQLGSASFISADLSEAWMIETGLSNAKLNMAKLIGSHLYMATLEAANMDSADLSSAFLNNANLTHASMRCSILIKANLSFADMSGVNCDNADFKDAILFKTNLSDANLKAAKNLQIKQLESACINEKTTLPDDINGSVLENCKKEPGRWWYMNFKTID